MPSHHALTFPAGRKGKEEEHKEPRSKLSQPSLQSLFRNFTQCWLGAPNCKGGWKMLCFLKRFYLFISRQKRREGEREERNISVWLPLTHTPTGDVACNPGMCPDWESNQQLFGSQASTQSTEPHKPGYLVLNRH